MLGLYTLVPVRFGNLYMDSFNLVFSVILSYFANQHQIQEIKSEPQLSIKDQVVDKKRGEVLESSKKPIHRKLPKPEERKAK